MLKERYNYITVLRLLALTMVIILHCICDYYYNLSNAGQGLWTLLGYGDELMRTGVPLFFMISGFLLMKDDITDVAGFYKKRILKVGIPFIIYDVFYYLHRGFEGEGISITGFFSELIDNGSSYHFWFVYTIIFIYLLMPFLQKIVKNCDNKLLWMFWLLTIFQTTIRPFINTIFEDKLYLFLTDDGFIGYVGYVVLGYILGTCDINKKSRLLIYALGLVSFIAVPIINMLNVADKGCLLLTGGYTINHYIEAAAIFVWFRYNVHSCNKFVAKLSALSFTAYLIHVFILERIKPIAFNTNELNVMIIWMIATTLLSFGWAYIESVLVKNFKRLKKS